MGLPVAADVLRRPLDLLVFRTWHTWRKKRSDSGVNQIVFSSTCATYGIPEGLAVSEEHPQRPVNPYGESKLFIERVLHWYAQAYGLRSEERRVGKRARFGG